MNTVVAWLVSLIVSVAPPGRPQYIPEAKETVEEAQARIDDLAKDVASVIYNPQEKPMFSGPNGRNFTAAVVLSVMSFEGAFRKDVQNGKGKMSRGDHGRSWCLMQVQLGGADPYGHTRNRIVVQPDGSYEFTTDPSKGWGGEDLVADQTKCVRAGMALLRKSSCGSMGIRDRLRVYASGSCEGGAKESHLRMDRAIRWMSTKGPSFTDEQAISWVLQDLLQPQPTVLTSTMMHPSFL